MRKTINENIRSLRVEKGMTLQELASLVGTSKQTIQRYETGEISNIPYDKILKIAEVLHTTPQSLMGWDSPPGKLTEKNLIDAIYESLPPDAQARLYAYAKKLKELSDMEG